MLPLIFAGVAAVAAFTSAWQIQGMRYEAQLAERTAAHATELAQASADALAATLKLQKAKDEAEKRAAKRLADARADAARSATALGMLGDAADTALRSANESHSTCQSVVATSTDLLQQCGSRYRDMATQADQWVSEAVTLRDAWPTASPQSRQQ